MTEAHQLSLQNRESRANFGRGAGSRTTPAAAGAQKFGNSPSDEHKYRFKIVNLELISGAGPNSHLTPAAAGPQNQFGNCDFEALTYHSGSLIPN